MKTIRAIYEHGVFRPLTKVDLPEGCEVAFVPRMVRRAKPKRVSKNAMKKIYETLSRSSATGKSDIARRHDKHQP
ncbi:MAG: antitoxin family protein [Planctomycetes bacterium]|nr:antitoxin family protein [Planctomycetota bacterium]